MEFDGVPIGIGHGSPEGRRFCRSRYRATGCPGLAYSLGLDVNVAYPVSVDGCFSYMPPLVSR